MTKSILITLMGSLGDVVRGLTMVTPLKRKFPDAKITWLVEPKCLDMVRLHPQIDKIVVFKRNSNLRKFYELWKDLRAERYDLCLDLQRHFKSGVFSKLSGAKKIIGFHRKDAKEFNWLFSNQTIEAYPKDMPKIEHYWKFLEQLETPQPNGPDVNLDLGDQLQTLQKFGLPADRNYFVLVLGSSWDSKDWPISSYHKLINEIRSRKAHANFVLSGGKEHIAMGDELCASQREIQNQIFNLSGRTNLKELCAVIKNSSCVIGPDSGPGHLAAMLSVPFVGLFGPTDASRTAPYGEKVRILSVGTVCSPCYKRVCPGLDKICMRLLDPKDVAELAISLA